MDVVQARSSATIYYCDTKIEKKKFFSFFMCENNTENIVFDSDNKRSKGLEKNVVLREMICDQNIYLQASDGLK